MEEIRLRYWLSKTREYLTVDHPDVKALLGRESPEALAERLISGTRMADPAFRAQAATMTTEELAAADPLLAFVLANDATPPRPSADAGPPRSSPRPPARPSGSPRPGSPSTAPTSIPTPPSRCACPTARSRAGPIAASPCRPSPI
jgi:hypothetical protein